MAEVAAARAGVRATQAEEPLAPAAPSGTLDSLPSQSNWPLPPSPRPRKQRKKGRIWFYAATVFGGAALIAGVLLWGANGPLLPGAGAPTVTRGYWDLSDWTGLGALAVLVLGLPCAALLAFVGIAYQHNPRAPWWIAAFLLGLLGLKAVGWYREVAAAEEESRGRVAEHHTSPEVRAELDALVTWTVPESLQRYNGMEVTEDSLATSATLDAQTIAFGQAPFRCVQQQDHLPNESAAAQQAFAEFLAYSNKTTKPDITVEEKRERLRLITAAIKAGSWRAKLTDLLWQAKWGASPEESRQLAAELRRMADSGNPAAIAAVVSTIEDPADGQRIRNALMRSGMALGNPQILTTVGHQLATNTLEHRARGLAMLRCAADQGEVNAHHSMGLTASQEGRWVDAYRIFELGANQGCARCMESLENLAILKHGLALQRDRISGRALEIQQLVAFYNQQLCWQLTGLSEVRRPAPQSIQLHLSNEQIEGLIRLKMKQSGLKPARH
jgi:hypothetical protein